MKMFTSALVALAAALIVPGPAQAQCAGCNADFNKADRAAVKAMKDLEKLGTGMLRDTAEKMQKSHEKALNASKSD